MDEQQLWLGMERVWEVLEVVGVGQPEDLHHSQGGKETGRKRRVVQVEEMGCRDGTELTPSRGPEPEEQPCCQRPSEPRGSLGEEEEEQEGQNAPAADGHWNVKGKKWE